MAISTAVCNSFKVECMEGTHALETDVIKMALIKTSPSGTYGASTTNYSDVTGNSDEVTGTGYTITGNTLSNLAVTLDGSVAVVDFDDNDWADATFDCRGALIYNSSKSNKAIAVYDFGADKSIIDMTFRVSPPVAGATTAIIRLA